MFFRWTKTCSLGFKSFKIMIADRSFQAHIKLFSFLQISPSTFEEQNTILQFFNKYIGINRIQEPFTESVWK